MQYALLHGVRDLRIEKKSIPKINSNQVLIKISACGICGTDVLIYNGRIITEIPYSPGHEFSGIVQSIGKNIQHLNVGDRVTVDPNCSCGFCYHCRRGNVNICENLKKIKSKSNGGFAEYVSVPGNITYKIPDTISFEEATLIEPLSCCIHIIEEANIKFGDFVVIIGGGTMGLILLQLARQKGAGIIILSEPMEFKRELALKLGADFVINPTNESLFSFIKKINRSGANVVIEGIGLTETIKESIEVLNRKGTLVLAGLCSEDKTAIFSPCYIIKNEITIKGTFLNPFSFAKAIEQFSKIITSPLITRIYYLSDINHAMEEAEKSNQIKIIIKPTGDR